MRRPPHPAPSPTGRGCTGCVALRRTNGEPRVRGFIAIALALLLPLAAGAATEAYFSSRDDVQRRIVEGIQGSELSIDAALFELTSTHLLRTLEYAAQRGVSVRLLLDAHKPAPREVALSRCDVRYLKGRSRRGGGVMHHKFAIFDEQTLVTGSYNWTPGAQFSNYENALFEDDPHVVRTYRQQFEELWTKATDQPAKRSRHAKRRHVKELHG